jgi:hypothetical protein
VGTSTIATTRAKNHRGERDKTLTKASRPISKRPKKIKTHLAKASSAGFPTVGAPLVSRRSKLLATSHIFRRRFGLVRAALSGPGKVAEPHQRYQA